MEFNQGFSNEDGPGKSDKKVSNSKTTYKGELSFDLKNSVLSESDNSVINEKKTHEDSSDIEIPHINSFDNLSTNLITKTTNLKTASQPVTRKGFSIIENESK